VLPCEQLKASAHVKKLAAAVLSVYCVCDCFNDSVSWLWTISVSQSVDLCNVISTLHSRHAQDTLNSCIFSNHFTHTP